MEYRIVHKSVFTIVGFKKRITLQLKGINPQMNDVIERLTPSVIVELKSLCDTEPNGMLEVSAAFSERLTEGSELDHYIGVATTKTPPDGYDTLTVKESDWAVFTIIGSFPDALSETWARIYSEWFPASVYKLANGPEMVWYESPDLTKTDLKVELWIPLA